MKISIITAVYNGADSIATTLRSVAQQDHGDIEHIVIDGASTDSTLTNVRSNSQRISIVISEPDKGVYDAFNKGLRRATGDVVAFLNCGDTYTSPFVVSKMADTLARHEVQATFADVLIEAEKTPGRVIRRYSSKHFSPRTMAYGLMPAHPTLFMRREIYESVGEYDTRFRIAGDFELCLRAFARRGTSYQYIPEAMVRMPSGGISNSGWRSKWLITNEMRSACRLNGLSTNFAKLCLRFPLKIVELI
jgi:glycosyltransferase involved in cell wall biosynthesis